MIRVKCRIISIAPSRNEVTKRDEYPTAENETTAPIDFCNTIGPFYLRGVDISAISLDQKFLFPAFRVFFIYLSRCNKRSKDI